ncbi:hypothetical protein L7F22_060500 [Adiantum nelumboides]|nr:hypothetical protein [Adiantum nelumboides]
MSTCVLTCSFANSPSFSGFAGGSPPPALCRVPLNVDIDGHNTLCGCNPDINRPFASSKDAYNRLLPFHVLADYNVDDVNDKFLDSRVLSRSHLWNESLTSKIHEFKATFRKQVNFFNAFTKKRADREMRAEEGLMV